MTTISLLHVASAVGEKVAVEPFVVAFATTDFPESVEQEILVFDKS